MKKLHNTCIISLVFLAGGIFAQTDTVTTLKPGKKKTIYEMGMNIMGITGRSGDFYSQYNTVFDIQVFSGLYLKCFRGNNALRFGMDYSQRNVYYLKEVFDATSRIRSFELKAGYQRMLGKRKLATYTFIDLEYNRLRMEGQSGGGTFGDYIVYRDPRFSYYKVLTNFFCASPGLGLRWKPAKFIVINFESSLQLFYAKEKEVVSGFDKSTSVGTNVEALKLSIGFTF